MKLTLKKKRGSFELWTMGNHFAIVMAATHHKVGDPYRASIELLSCAGEDATRRASQVFNALAVAFDKALR